MKSESLNPHTGCSEQREHLAIMAPRAECVTLSERTPKEGTFDRGHDREPSEEKVPQLDL